MQPAVARLAPSLRLARPLAVLRAHGWMIAFILLYAAAAQIGARLLGVEDRVSLSLYSAEKWRLYGMTGLAFVVGYPVYVMLFVRPRQLLRYLADDLRQRILTTERILSGLLVLAVLPIFMSVFTSLKAMIPVVNPFDWDITLMAWDQALHGGFHPWELIHPLVGQPLVTSVINFAYHFWFFLLYGLIFWQAFTTANPALRAQFFLTFLLSWSVMGNLAAMAFSSVGPCYYGALTGLPDPFAPLMSYLQEANAIHPVWALDVQAMLWERLQGSSLESGSGISAMPSMHVAAAVLFALFGQTIHRTLGLALWGYALVILVGSVHLGWHYALDGYAALLGTALLWALSGFLVRRFSLGQA